jgi:hypothetical protein
LVLDKCNYIVEFTGNNSFKKNKMIYKLKTYFVLSGFNVLVVDNFDVFKKDINKINSLYDLVLIDRGILDKITNLYVMNSFGKIDFKMVNDYIRYCKKNVMDSFDMFVVLKNKDDYSYNSYLDKCLKKYVSGEKTVYNINNYEFDNDDLLSISNIIINNMRDKYLGKSYELYTSKKKVKK